MFRASEKKIRDAREGGVEEGHRECPHPFLFTRHSDPRRPGDDTATQLGKTEDPERGTQKERNRRSVSVISGFLMRPIVVKPPAPGPGEQGGTNAKKNRKGSAHASWAPQPHSAGGVRAKIVGQHEFAVEGREGIKESREGGRRRWTAQEARNALESGKGKHVWAGRTQEEGGRLEEGKNGKRDEAVHFQTRKLALQNCRVNTSTWDVVYRPSKGDLKKKRSRG